MILFLLNPYVVLLVFGCSPTYVGNADVPDQEVTEDESCLSGLGEPDASSFQGEIHTEWMTEHGSYRARVECLDFPELRIDTDQDGERPVNALTLVIGNYDDGSWVDKLGGALTARIGDIPVGPFNPTNDDCTLGICGPAWILDLTPLGIIVSRENAIAIDFALATFDDPSGVDELWDEEDDDLLIYAEAAYFWSETDDETTYYKSYTAGQAISLSMDAQ